MRNERAVAGARLGAGAASAARWVEKSAEESPTAPGALRSSARRWARNALSSRSSFRRRVRKAGLASIACCSRSV